MPSAVSALLQARSGDLWLATGWALAGMEWGVLRYDGSRLHAFTTADGLAHNRVRTLLEDRQGRLWFGTFGGGLSCYDGEGFETYSTADGLADDEVVSLLEDGAGDLWVGTLKDLSRWDGQRFHTYTTKHGLEETYFTTDGLPRIGVSSLLQDRQGQIWAGTWGGVSRWDGERFHTFTSRDGLANDWVRCLLEDREGRIWVGTGVWDSGAGRMEQKGGISVWDGHSFQTYTTDHGLARGMVRCLLEDRLGQIWVGTWGGGVSRWDGQRFETYATEQGLANNQVFSLLEDRTGQVWMGTVGGGLSRFDQSQLALFTTADGLPSDGVLALMEDNRGRIWAGTWEGTAYWDGGTWVPLEELSGKSVYGLAEDCNGNVWFGTFGDGVICWDGSEIRAYTRADGLSGDEVRDLLVDRHGQVWAATNIGPSCFDGTAWRTCTETDGLHNRETRALLEDRCGDLWIATDGGISRYDGQAYTAITSGDGLAHDSVRAILQDRRGHLWMATDGGGVSRFDGTRFETFSTAHGLCHDQVECLLEDRDGHLWLGTFGGGVSRYDGRVFQALTRRDGLAHDAVHQVLQDRRGDIWIATEGGVTRYRSQSAPPRVQLTEAIADRHYGRVEALHLPASQQVLIFGFRGTSLTTRPDGMVYVYRLAGYDYDWQVAYGPRAEYPQLPVGEYTFEVRAVDRDLNYSESASAQVTVEPDPRLEGWKEALITEGPDRQFVGTSPAVRRVQQQLAQAGPTDMTVLILGETGTGKGLAARALHGLSDRKAGPFLAVNCGGLPSGLVESELFGHEKGAFTGATRRKLGRVELAEGGTLFLDEIGDLPAEAQVKVLHFLEDRTFERVGGTQTLQADVRLAVATNRDLALSVADGHFREDLFFRIQGFTVRLPPLRERGEDIAQLAHYFRERMATHLHKEVSGLTPEALAMLQAYEWPGNVRELEHAIKRAVIVCEGGVIPPEDIALAQTTRRVEDAIEMIPLEEVERRHIRGVLQRTGWVVAGAQGAAAVLGMPEATLRHRMKKLGIRRPES